MRLFLAVSLLSVFILPDAKAQETLPGFSASLKSNGKVLISWRNTYPAINQISIQRSIDSLRNFTTLITVPDPRVPENGFVDSKLNGGKMYYRIFILFPNSRYMFTKSRRAVLEPVEQPEVLIEKPIVKTEPKPALGPVQKPAIQKPAVQNPAALTTEVAKAPVVKAPVAKPAETEEAYLILPKIDNSRIYYMMETPNLKKPSVNNPGKIRAPTIEVQKVLYVKRRDTVIMMLPGSRVGRFSDSMVRQTKDTLYFVNADTIQIKPYVEVYKEPKEVYKASSYVFTAKDGNVTISLADYSKKKYSVIFFEGDSTQILEIKEVKDSNLTIDKTNFGHAGWFRFELYEDGKLREKNKFLLPKE